MAGKVRKMLVINETINCDTLIMLFEGSILFFFFSNVYCYPEVAREKVQNIAVWGGGGKITTFVYKLMYGNSKCISNFDFDPQQMYELKICRSYPRKIWKVTRYTIETCSVSKCSTGKWNRPEET